MSDDVHALILQSGSCFPAQEKMATHIRRPESPAKGHSELPDKVREGCII
jgi:hypothetical protein